MTTGLRFERFHDIIIEAPASTILNYVSNPNSWPEWLASSHEVISPQRPLEAGEIFEEHWSTRTGAVTLHWRVTARQHPYLWEAETQTSFTGPIVVRYEIEGVPGGHRFRRRLINPARPKLPTEEMIKRTDEEAVLSLNNIKTRVELL